MDNRAGEMEAFATAIATGSFSAAARRLGLSPSAVSKIVSRIEDRLGTRLLMRSTRALTLTAEGEVYLARATRILAEIEETERVVAGTRGEPQGRLRVSVSVGFGVMHVVPLVPRFLARFPRVELDLSLTDDVIDLFDERTDIGIRAGPLRDSSLKARKVVQTRRVIVASPGYLERHGTPRVPRDLAAHNCLRFNFRSNEEWPFRDPGTGDALRIPISGNVFANNGPTLRRLAIEGVGLARLGQFHVQRDIEAGRLVTVLDEHNAEDIELIHAVFVGHDHLAARIRAFIDFLVEALGGPTAEG